MVHFTKIRWIPILMILSQVMLAGFVAYWLVSQYKDENELMNEELSRIYDETRNQVIDSLLFNQVVEPALNDSVTVTMIATNNCDTAIPVLKKPTHLGGFYQAEGSLKKAMVTVSIPDTLPSRNLKPGKSIAITGNKQDILIRSVKLIFNHGGDSITASGSLPGFLPGSPDVTLFKKVYNEKLAKKKFGVDVVWSTDSSKSGEGGEGVKGDRGGVGVDDIGRINSTDAGGMHFTSIFAGYLPEVQIRRDFPYLIRRISSQILFALILLLLTGSAFFFTNRSLKRQMILNSLRNDFVSNITHELRTPVSTVKVALEALKTFDKVSNPAVTRDYLDMAGQEMNRLDQLISKVLDQSLIGEQKQVIKPQLSDLRYLIKNVLLSLQPRLAARRASVKFNFLEMNESVMVDPLYFQGVLINLIDNSLKYGPENPEIGIFLWQGIESVYIEVSDNGPGIPKKYISRVFDKFFRVPTGDTHNIKGYGLGLSFAALVMKQHQGSISVKNLGQGGCAFTLRFPLKTV